MTVWVCKACAVCDKCEIVNDRRMYEEECLKWKIEVEYQREWNEYWRAQYNMATKRIPDVEMKEPNFLEIKKRFCAD